MKKFLAIFIAVITVLSCFVLSASAASPKDDIIAAAKANIPSKYQSYYLVTLENTLNSITVTQEQADKIVKIIEDTRAVITTDKGVSLHNYTDSEITFIVGKFGEACEVLGLTYEFYVTKYNVAYHSVNDAVRIYDANGKLLCELDADIVKKTDVDATASDNYMTFIFLVAVVVAGGVVFVISRRISAAK